jgi:hypothetical protein
MMGDNPDNDKKWGVLAASLFMSAVFALSTGTSASEGNWKSLYAKGLEHFGNEKTDEAPKCFETLWR